MSRHAVMRCEEKTKKKKQRCASASESVVKLVSEEYLGPDFKIATGGIRHTKCLSDCQASFLVVLVCEGVRCSEGMIRFLSLLFDTFLNLPFFFFYLLQIQFLCFFGVGFKR